ncbi:MAG TPA: hypothetical protein PKZ07_14715 [Sedimentisphaerales bacterium]|nr:hypothetical protein [Sedimentisphaerales bacterium]
MRQIKLNNCATWLGNATSENNRLSYCLSKGIVGIQLYGLYGVFGNATMEARLAAFIAKAYAAPYNMQYVGCIMGSGFNGFQLAINYNASVAANQRFNLFNKENEFWFGMRRDYEIASVLVGFTYSITINLVTYSYTAIAGDTVNTIAGQLATRITAANFNIVVNGDTISVTGPGIVYWSSSNSARINVSLISEDFESWIQSIKDMKAALLPGQYISAYVANPFNNWGMTEADQMVGPLTWYEGTNYTTAPNATTTNFRYYQLDYIGKAALAKIIPTTQKILALHSAEPAFMGPYLQANGLNNSEATWNAQYAAMAFPGKTGIVRDGFCYFDYNRMITYVP